MITVEYIDPNSSIGDSISSLNNNFSLIDESIRDLEQHTLKYTNLFNNYYNLNYANYLDSATNINKNFALWEQASTIISSNSARWLQPLTLLYPCILNEQEYRATIKIRDEITNWINSSFSVTIGDDVNYVEDQTAYVSFTYKQKQQPPNYEDETIYNNIQTIKFKVKGCEWVFDDYLLGSLVAPTPTPAPSLTKTPTPTKTPYTTPTPTNTPPVTQTPTLTPSVTPIDYFTMTLIGYSNDTDTTINGTGGMSFILKCGYGGWYTVRIGQNVYAGDDNTPIIIKNLNNGDYTVFITNYNSVRELTTQISGNLTVVKAGLTVFTYKGSSIFPGEVIQSS